MPAEVQYFGIRHHGPGSAKALLAALDAMAPLHVLIEGPADCSGLLPLLADPAMKPPVALLAYAEDNPGEASFWPVAEYSPEYLAVRWAVAHGASLEFIDLPVSWRVAPKPENHQEDQVEQDQENGAAEEDRPFAEDPISADPIGTLAHIAGYEDGESWWRDVIEENPAPGPIFAAISDAMTALRAHTSPAEAFEAAREAHMRLAIAKARKEAVGSIAVVCGAWHVPALKAKHAQKDDRALLKNAAGAPSGKKRKIAATFAPWSSPRLASRTGYGAGVAAPAWCAHVFANEDAISLRWIARIAQLLREDGQIVSTASLIETERLAVTLAAMRDRPGPSFEDIREAAVATLCNGNQALWHSICERLLIGNEVGAIPENVPLAPLLEDLQRQQKRTRLKPEALEKEISLDLRTEAGLARSTLLHRLALLDAPWGQLSDAGRSRGTFRERWVLMWEPQYAVGLVENTIFGQTIERAASGRAVARFKETKSLADLADSVRMAMTAQLPEAAQIGIERLSTRAAQTSDCAQLLAALPPIGDLVRYGEARSGDTGKMLSLMQRIAMQGGLALGYAARGLDAQTAKMTASAVRGADAAIRLVELPEADIDHWEGALEALLVDPQVTRLVAGAAAQLLFNAQCLDPEEAEDLLVRMLSPAVPVPEAAGFFEGFFDGACERLIYDAGLRKAVDGWLVSLDPEIFTEFLPLFRRVFSVLDKMARTRLLEAAFGREGGYGASTVLLEDGQDDWQRHMKIVVDILDGRGRNG